MEGVFEGKINEYLSQHERLREKYNRISIIRTVVFLLATVAFIYFANQRNFVFVTIIGLSFPLIFALLLKFHQRIAYKKAHASFLQSINDGEIRRLKRDLRLFDGGERFLADKHPYAIDLDIFGQNSLFQLLNRCTTESGKRLLGYWLNSPAKKEDIVNRQEAIGELRPMVDWRQDFQASGMHYEDKESTVKTLLEWLALPLEYENAKGYKFLIIFMPLVSVAAIVLYFTGIVHYLIPLCTLLVNLFLLRKATPLATKTQEQTYLSIKSLKAYQSLINKIEQQEFKSQVLVSIHSHFSHQNFSAGTEIRKLEKILDWLNSRNNAFYFIFNLVFLIDIQLLIMAERWKKRTKSDVAEWFDAISHMEALVSMSGFAYSHPAYTFPEISDDPYNFSGKQLGHPLLKERNRVDNDFSFHGKGSIIVLTGSNMSGKSTFLRTLGTNAVLALMGNVVCAESLKIGWLRIFTSMRTVDSLEESVSSFYAELQRLKQLLDSIDDNQPTFFMLDEILKGTNSYDRHKGAASLIKQLHKLNVLGIVSTHDIELGSMSERLAAIDNYSFTSVVENDEIIFDYKLHPGICQSFNASKLMERMGIEIEDSKL